jgi:hypothetical protein
MTRNPFTFFVELVRQPAWIPIWVFALMLVNMASVAFWEEPLARLILATSLLSAMLMMGLYSWFGYEKILSLGRVPWVPLIVYVLSEIPAASGGFRSCLVVWLALTAISLVLDAIAIQQYITEPRHTRRVFSRGAR